jgi:hypothetical protein
MPDVFVAKEKDPVHVTPTPQPTRPSAPASSPPSPSAVKKPSLRFFTAFQVKPQGLHFEDQEENERIELFLRRHFLSNLDWIMMSIVSVLIPPLGSLLFFVIDLSAFTIPGRFTLILLLFYYLILLGYAYINFVMWFYNVGIVTNQRVIDVDLSSLTTKNVAATTIRDIKDVSYHQKGLLSSFFDYGDVFIQTEGLRSNFEFNAVPHPDKIADTISTLVSKQPTHD